MTSFFLWVASILLIIVVKESQCSALNLYNKSEEISASKMVEVLQLMLSQKPKDDDKKSFEIQKIPKNEHGVNYEILITPNKNLPQLKGSQKIKIYVEAENFEEEQKNSKSSSVKMEGKEKQNIFDVLPLSIESEGSKLETYQQPPAPTAKYGSENEEYTPKDFESNPSKRQTNWKSQRSKTPSQSESKILNCPPNIRESVIHTDPSYVEQNNPYRIIAGPVKEERQSQPTYHGDYSSSSQNGKKIIQQSYGDDYLEPVEDSRRTNFEKEYKKNYENSYDDNVGYEETRTSKDRRPGTRDDKDSRRPGRYPEVKQTKSIYIKGNDDGRTMSYNRENEDKRPNYETEEVRPSSSNSRSIYSREPEENRPVYSREPEESRPVYSREPEENRPVYSREPEESRPVYSREPEESRPVYSREPEESRPVYSREPEESRPSKERHPQYEVQYEEEIPSRQPVYIQRPEEVRPSKNEWLPFEKERNSGSYDDNENNSSYRPVREDNSGYSGFPESNQQDVNHHYSRPLQYEPVRAFPASPCLHVFKYQGREPEEDRWYADIYVTTDEVLNGLRLDITLDRPAELLTNWLSEVKTKDSIHFTILSLTQKLIPGPAETVRIMVKFNGKKPVPYLKSINLNGRLICPSNRLQKTTTKKPLYENVADLHVKPTSEKYPMGQKRPGSFVEEYESSTKRTTAHVERRTTPPYEEIRKPNVRPPSSEYHRPNPNPNGYEETDLNSFTPSTKKPHGRPAHSNGKPPPHAAKPAQGNRPSNGQGHGHGHGQGYGNNKGSASKNPSFSSQNPSSQNNKPLPIFSSEQASQKPVECGTPSVQPSPLITHGQLTSRGQWPWHAALYKNVGTDLTFFCGGTLINYNHVLTAAHCVTKTYTTRPLDENTLVVYLGKYHLKLWSEGGVQNRQVSKIYIHPKYNSTDFRSDIAVLALSAPVEYTDYVRPICLWDRANTRIEDVEGKLGTVVGWGFDETKKLTEELRQAKMPVVEQKTCLWSYPDFYPQFTSNMTYCAGFKNGTSVCNGDSGGGMVFPYKYRTGEERWHIRGIVSISPARNDSRVCDTSHYVVFTDVAKYLPWLDNFV